MKKIIALMCAVVITLSLAACNGKPEAPASSTPVSSVASVSSEAPASSTAPAEPELSPYEQAKKAILEHVDVAYTGLTPAKAPMYFMSDNEGEYVALILENKDGKSYIKFIGSADIDEANNILTVTDSDTGYSFGFSAEKQANGTFFLDCGNLGEAYLMADEPENVVDNIMKTLQTMEDVTERVVDAVARTDFMESLDLAYTGLSAATEAPMFFLASSDGAFAAVVLVSPNGEEYISFVGSAVADVENKILTVTDNEKGYWFGFKVDEQEDGSLYLDCGNMGEAYLEPDTVENVVNYIDTVYLELTDITDEFMTELAS